uniref:Ribonuclease Z n=1 Tax=Haraldiophyllum bonnemaisonii TaxID=167977 RepID=A0A4D6WX22_9FLOR|nr:ribonuclease Z [Haraldiophyllum bonnemaisonii]
MQLEQYGSFLSNKAKNYYLVQGPLYGQLKKGSDFILPDGSFFKGKNFTSLNLVGQQFSFFLNYYLSRNILENSLFSNILFYR